VRVLAAYVCSELTLSPVISYYIPYIAQRIVDASDEEKKATPIDLQSILINNGVYSDLYVSSRVLFFAVPIPPSLSASSANTPRPPAGHASATTSSKSPKTSSRTSKLRARSAGTRV